MPDKDPIALVGEIQATMQSMKADNEAVMAAIKASTETAGSDAKAAIKAANDLAVKIQAQADAILDMEQRLGEKVLAEKAAPETLGRVVIQSDSFKNFASGKSQKMHFVQANTITGQAGSPAENSDILVGKDRLSGIIPGAFRALRILDVLPSGTTTSNAVEYTRELLFTNAAAETSEGAQKPEATLTFELVTANVRTIAHIIKVSKQVLEDSAQLESYIDNRMRYGVQLRYENQIVNGDGTNPNISGITDSGNFTAFTATSGENQLDGLNRMITLVRVAEYEPTAILMNPVDWGIIERLKHGTGDARYVIGNPAGGITPMLWGLPVVATNTVASGKAIVSAFDISHQVFNRSGVVVEMFEQDDTNVQKNLLTLRAEARGTLATFRPASCYYGDLVV